MCVLCLKKRNTENRSAKSVKEHVMMYTLASAFPSCAYVFMGIHDYSKEISYFIKGASVSSVEGVETRLFRTR